MHFPNFILTPPTRYSLKEVLNASCLTVSIFSSTILESVASGVLPMVFNMTSLPTYCPDIHSAGSGIEVKDFDAATNVIRQVLTDGSFSKRFKPAIENFKQHYFYTGSRKPADHIADEIVSLCEAARS